MNGDDRIDSLLADLLTPAPPAGFADRVVRAHASARRRRRALSLGLGVAMAAAMAAWFVSDGRHQDAGQAVATRRESVRVGEHVVVLEPKASIRWTSDASGATVTHEAGSAFYRAAAPMVVRTPVAEIAVLGTSFSVRLQQEASMRAAFPVGLAAGTALTVIVYEGIVDVKNDHGRVSVSPGELAFASAGAAPVRKPHDPEGALARTRAENDNLTRALTAAHASAGGDGRELLSENERLRRKLADAEDELALVEDAREQNEGVPRGFPVDLPPRFQKPALARAFEAALADIGADGRVTDVDCDEFPCIVYGDVDSTKLDTMKLAERLKEGVALAGYRDDGDHSAWMRTRNKDDATGVEVDETHFAIAYYPKAAEKSGDEEMERRLRHRHETRWRQTFEKR